MTDIPLPAPGDPDWVDWGEEQETLSDAAREIVSGRLTDAALKAAFVRRDTLPGLVAGSTASAAANSSALAAFVADRTRGPLLSITTPGTYYFDGSMDCTNLTNPIREVYLGAGVELVQNRATTSSSSKAYGLIFKGSLETGTVRYFTANANRHSTTITLDNVSGLVGEGPDEPTGSARDQLSSGTVLYLFSDDRIHSGGKYRNAALHRVVTVATNTLTLDAPLYRNWTTANNAAAVVATLHPSVHVHGPGRIRHANPWANGTFYASLLRFEFCENVTVGPEVRLGPGPGVGLDLLSVWGFDVQPQTEHLLSDDAVGNNGNTWHPSNTAALGAGNEQAHYGYGVTAGGASRDGFVGGAAHHVRHAFTTVQSPDVTGMSALKTAVLNTGRLGSEPQNGGDPWDILVTPRVWGTWQQPIDTHEAGHDITIDVSGVAAGTWDDTLEEAQQAGVNVRCNDVDVTGRLAGGGIVGVIIAFQSQANPEFGQTRLSDLRIGPTPEAIRVNSGVGTRLVLNGVHTHGCKQFLRVKGANAHHITGEGNFADGTGIAEDSGKRIIFSDTAVPAASWIDLGVDYVNFANVVNYNGSGLSQANTVVRRTTDRRQIGIVYDGTAWPATRPQVPAGDLTLVSPVAGVAAPTWLLRGDTYLAVGGGVRIHDGTSLVLV